MKQIGEYLKNRRIELGISLDEAEQSLKIRKKYLIGIEEGNENILPGRTYFIGYLRNYANYLDADQEYISKLLEGTKEAEEEKKAMEEELREEQPEKKKVSRKKSKSTGKYFYPDKRKYRPKREKRSINYIPFLKIIIILILLGGIIFVVNQFLNRMKEPSTPVSQNDNNNFKTSEVEEKSIEEELAQMAEENLESEEIEPLTAEVFLEPIPGYKPVKIVTQEPTWVKIVHDEEILYEDFVLSEEEVAIKLEGLVSVITTSSDSISVFYDDIEIEAQPSGNYRLVQYQIAASAENN
jgi:cytoskeletal protein RodZ